MMPSTISENPFAQPEALFQLIFFCTEHEAPLIESVFEDMAIATSLLPAEDANTLQLRVYVAHVEQQNIAHRIDILRSVHGLGIAFPMVKPVEQKDWVAEVQRYFTPINAGSFFVHDDQHRTAIPSGAIAIEINAGAAFGTGHHATTSGCLRMIDSVAARWHEAPHAVLDMGCGTAILAIAMAKRWPACKVVASDNDAVAVRVSQENGRINGVDSSLQCICAEGYAHAEIARAAPYGLIVANILAHPLIAMSEDLAQHLASGGYAILSGFREDSREAVCAAHQKHGLSLVECSVDDGWCCALLHRM